jgi:hypothetical protein
MSPWTKFVAHALSSMDNCSFNMAKSYDSKHELEDQHCQNWEAKITRYAVTGTLTN